MNALDMFMRYEMIVETKDGILSFDLVKYQDADDYFGDTVVIAADNRGCNWDYILRAIVAFNVQVIKVYNLHEHQLKYPE